MSDIAFQHQVLVVGGGLAGLRAAIEVRDRGLDVAVVSHVHPVRSHSGAAQGGINASLGNAGAGRDDSWEKHAYDTVRGSDYLADQDAVETAVRDAPLRVYESEHWGVPYSRTDAGLIAQRPFGGAGFPRTCYAADKTGHMLLQTMYEQTVKRQIKVYWDWVMLQLVAEDGACRGIVAMHLPTGELASFAAQATIFATGGAGRTYLRTTNSLVSTGYGMVAAYRAGVPLKDMEFIQFHPTTIIGNNILMSEAARGEGAYLLNKDGDRFMQRYAPSVMELAPRDIVSRAIQTEIDEGRGFEGGYVHLDIRHLGRERILEALPGIRDIAITFVGIDPIDQPVPIQPAQHYTMGGIDADVNGATPLKGFFAAGECACVSLHGANRLGGNSLMETIVIGPRAGRKAAEEVQGDSPAATAESALASAQAEEQAHINGLLAQEGPDHFSRIREAMATTMTENVGIFRNREMLQEAVDRLRQLRRQFSSGQLKHRGRRYNLELLRCLETEAMLELNEVIAIGALEREESRGSHARRDFPQRDDQKWLAHTIAERSEGGPRFSYRPVTITRWPPEVRKY
ncbi:MAG: FAD-binding protein [Bacteroidetes bacterium]|nr:FAD-binding protein [Bacteroidota bacterium]